MKPFSEPQKPIFDPQKVGHFMEQYIPFNQFLGMKMLSVTAELVEIELPFKPELIGDPQRQAVHGGVLSALIDVAGGTVCWAAMQNLDGRVSTVDLRVDYLRRGPPETLLCRAHLVRLGRSVAVAKMEVFGKSDLNSVVATGHGVYNLVHQTKYGLPSKKDIEP